MLGQRSGKRFRTSCDSFMLVFFLQKGPFKPTVSSLVWPRSHIYVSSSDISMFHLWRGSICPWQISTLCKPSGMEVMAKWVCPENGGCSPYHGLLRYNCVWAHKILNHSETSAPILNVHVLFCWLCILIPKRRSPSHTSWDSMALGH